MSTCSANLYQRGLQLLSLQKLNYFQTAEANILRQEVFEVNKVNSLPYVHRSQVRSQKEKTLACTLCDYRTYRNYLLIVHMNAKHDAEKFPCKVPGCLKVYSSKCNVRNHMKSNHICPKCDHIAEANSTLRLHKRIEHKINC